MALTIGNRQLYTISIRHKRGNHLMWQFQSWHPDMEDALRYGRKQAGYHYADEPAAFIIVSAELAS